MTFNDTEIVGSKMVAFDPTKHVDSWRTAWRTLTKKAGLPGFRFHDLRHCAITSLAESGASDSTIMAIAGHVSRRDAGAVQSRPHGSQAQGSRIALERHWNGGL